MLNWTDCTASTPEQQIIYAQLEILRRLDSVRIAGVSSVVLPRPGSQS